MKRKESARESINRLYQIRNCFGGSFGIEKYELLESIRNLAVRSAADARRLHKALCFIRAFPDTTELHRCASDFLSSFEELVEELASTQRYRLDESGITSTDIHYSFSFEVAAWLARKHPGRTQVDWAEMDDTRRFDELLEHLLEPAETDYFDSGQVSTQEWLNICAEKVSGTEFDWLMAQLDNSKRYARFWTPLYNAADIALRCTLSGPGLSVSTNVFDVAKVSCRTRAMRSRVSNARKQICSPVSSVRRLDHDSGTRLVDVAMASLAVRHRETLHFNYANADEVYLADVGRGVHIAVTGLQPESRYPLETTMGFLILSNGVPVGYGGASILFRQVNTGINIFDEYRGGEAAWLWVQVMRVFHSLTGCTRYIANPYQFGSENSEALQSGAFWFYYRLGYRPVEADVRRLAKDEFLRVRSDKLYRTPLAKLKDLAACDMHLVLPDARKDDFFDEAWIETTGLLATRQLSGTGELLRSRARSELCRHLADVLNMDALHEWTTAERKWFATLSPLIAETDPAAWPAKDKRALVRMIRAKGSTSELDYAREARKLPPYFSALKKSCRLYN